MKIKSPIVTLIIGVLIAVVIWILSVQADGSAPAPYGAVVPAVVLK